MGGVYLTVVAISNNLYTVTIDETIKRNLGSWEVGTGINLKEQ
jgi:riboflavin synthase alpha subunit